MHHFARIAAAALAAAALATPLLAVDRAGAAGCTAATSTWTPPASIRVLRTYGAAKGTVQQVEFRSYVETVMASEWPAAWPREALRAGAVAVKQYAWYHARTWRGGTAADGTCYDVVDTTTDQVYRPEERVASSTHRAAVAATWPVSVRKGTSFVMTGYRAGSSVPCASNADGYRLYQWSVRQCALGGMTYESILRRYYYPALAVVSPGQQHAAGSALGDAAAVVRGSADGRIRPTVWPSGSTTLAAAAPGPDLLIAASRRRGYVAADVTGDGREDFVYLIRDGATAQRVAVAPATGTGYGSAKTWWSSAVEGPALAFDQGGLPALHLVGGDFDGDGRDDVALVAGGTDAARMTVHLLPSLGTDFGPAVGVYGGPGNVRGARVAAAEITGDGRADLVLQQDLGTAGVRFLVLASSETRTALAAPATWLDTTTMRHTTTQWTAGDVDRDGRDDVLAFYPSSTGPRITALLSRSPVFVRDHLWTAGALADDPRDASRVRIGRADLNGDGAVDVVGFVDGRDGTISIDAFLTNGLSQTRQRRLTAVPTAWSDLAPY